jgi:mannitol-specific phosphotransferase system IIBC component
MKWGQRKAPSSKPPAVSADHITAEAHKAKIKEGGVKVLSNQDLKQLNERLQLEQTHRDLTEKAPGGKYKTTNAHIDKFLKTGKKLNDLHNTLNGPIGKAVVKKVIKKKIGG